MCYIFVVASPPKFVNFEDIMQAANGVSNMALAHEIAVDNEFRFKKQEYSENRYHSLTNENLHYYILSLLKVSLILISLMYMLLT